MNGEERWQPAGSLERFNAGEMFAGSADSYRHLLNGKMGEVPISCSLCRVYVASWRVISGVSHLLPRGLKILTLTFYQIFGSLRNIVSNSFILRVLFLFMYLIYILKNLSERKP